MGRTERNGHDGSPRLAGRYRLIEKLGTGGMSVVWRGYDEILGRDVAVKVLEPGLAEDRTFRDRLRQEALAAARLCHPHITGIHDFGEAPISDRLTVPYVVMELNDGESFGSRLGRQGALEWREAVMIVTEVASALATAHARGVVHRDVTPANVMLTGAGAKIVDFGISAVVGQRDAAPDGSLLGTPAYLAPERLGGSSVSPATDVYALGLLLYRGLTGRMPWPAESTTEALRAHLYADPEPIPDLPGMPPVIAELCLRCLAKSPADRPAAAEVARGLAATVGLRPIIPPLRPGERPAVRAVVAVPLARDRSGIRRGVRAYLRSPATLRLRAGLRLRTVLRLGSVRPLGGGLFVGGRRSRALTPPERLRDRRSAIAALATVVLLASGLLNWSARREVAEPDRTSTTATGTGVPAVDRPSRVRCTVRYQVRRDSGGYFEARLSVITTETSGWRVEFSYPGGQRLAATPRAVTQQGRRVVLTGRGRSRVVTLHGGYRQRNPLPLSFALNGQPCRAEVTGLTGPAPPGSESVNTTTIEERAPEPKTSQQRKRVPSRRGGAPRPGTGAAPAPAAKRATGFSLAL
ncbi:protein kinase [Actinoplanes hulinensis]|uniref:non-specific serine/threonine protein kinase n=1 Tax=Actinoplanes hulinensis TaxID=1144547 RepID=A0ABS7AVI3_9ACTN|nr:serine/threonine-protein kinase [Actinoplanes hulinensis]MBW6432781.1 protein kinase [Actinoplanes hulinensis]